MVLLSERFRSLTVNQRRRVQLTHSTPIFTGGSISGRSRSFEVRCGRSIRSPLATAGWSNGMTFGSEPKRGSSILSPAAKVYMSPSSNWKGRRSTKPEIGVRLAAGIPFIRPSSNGKGAVLRRLKSQFDSEWLDQSMGAVGPQGHERCIGGRSRLARRPDAVCRPRWSRRSPVTRETEGSCPSHTAILFLSRNSTGTEAILSRLLGRIVTGAAYQVFGPEHEWLSACSFKAVIVGSIPTWTTKFWGIPIEGDGPDS